MEEKGDGMRNLGAASAGEWRAGARTWWREVVPALLLFVHVQRGRSGRTRWGEGMETALQASWTGPKPSVYVCLLCRVGLACPRRTTGFTYVFFFSLVWGPGTPVDTDFAYYYVFSGKFLCSR